MINNWEVKRLGKVCELINRGVSPKYIESDGLCVLNQKCIRNHRINYDSARFHDNKAKSVSNEKLIQIGDVLVNSTGTGTLGRVAQVRENPNTATVDSHVTIVRPLKNLFYNDFFGYALVFIEDEIAKKGEGCGGQTELSRDTLKNNFKIAYPKSLPEQQRIVSILDESFAAIDKAKENAEKNMQNARELFNSYLQSIFANMGDGCEEKKLGEVCGLISGQHIDSKNYNTQFKGIGYLTGPSDFGSLHPIVSKWTEFPKVTANKGDILITVKGSGIGKINLLDIEEVIISRQLMAIRTKKTETTFIYAFLILQYNFFQSLSNGAAIPGLSRKDVLNLKCPIPPISEQKSIVAKIDAFTVEAKKLETIYQQKLVALDELKKSVLQKAFNGGLAGA